jgi:hypothetical protein
VENRPHFTVAVRTVRQFINSFAKSSTRPGVQSPGTISNTVGLSCNVH